MSNVYVVQNQQIRDRDSREMRSKFDLSPAEDYGSLKFLLSSSDLPFKPQEVICKLRKGLEDFSQADYILLIGNPCLIGWTVAIASQMTGGPIKLLQWHTLSQSYISIESNVG